MLISELSQHDDTSKKRKLGQSAQIQSGWVVFSLHGNQTKRGSPPSCPLQVEWSRSRESTSELTGCPGTRRWSQVRLRPLAVAAVWLLSDTTSCRVWAEEALVRFTWFRT
ncbi:serine/threonine-protein kinase Nek11 isoform X1 [Lates japonicus]|uniref:Serine/threonine-protein kinase Nek11 isoform X1 n=1 Tax=Lates japonicus TaxID=270547 RepID=A0AAD3NAY0_LATJO|nr:serine/threonine-protein kinase Nek11 isoform X1 [Lates japonicus]